MKEKKKAFGKKILSLVLTACMFATTLTPTLATIAYAQQMNATFDVSSDSAVDAGEAVKNENPESNVSSQPQADSSSDESVSAPAAESSSQSTVDSSSAVSSEPSSGSTSDVSSSQSQEQEVASSSAESNSQTSSASEPSSSSDTSSPASEANSSSNVNTSSSDASTPSAGSDSSSENEEETVQDSSSSDVSSMPASDSQSDSGEEKPEQPAEEFVALTVTNPAGEKVLAEVGKEVTLSAGVNREDVDVSYQWQRMQLAMPETEQEDVKAVYSYSENAPTWYMFPLDNITEAEALKQNPDAKWNGIEMYLAAVEALDEIGADSSSVSFAWRTPNYVLDGYKITAESVDDTVKLYAEKDGQRYTAVLNAEGKFEFSETEETAPQSENTWIDVEGATEPSYTFTVAEEDYYAQYRLKVTILDEEYLSQCIEILEEQGVELTQEQRAEQQNIYSVVMQIESSEKKEEAASPVQTENGLEAMVSLFAVSTQPYLSEDGQWICGLNGNYEYITEDTYNRVYQWYKENKINSTQLSRFWTYLHPKGWAGGEYANVLDENGFPTGQLRTYNGFNLTDGKLEVASEWYGKIVYFRVAGTNSITKIKIPAYTELFGDGDKYSEAASGSKYKKAITFLNPYTLDTGSMYENFLNFTSSDGWLVEMDASGNLTGNRTDNHIEVYAVDAVSFNADPQRYMVDAEGNYRMDSVGWGVCTREEPDISGKAYWVLKDYIANGYGFLTGHDTMYAYAGAYYDAFGKDLDESSIDPNDGTTWYYDINSWAPGTTATDTNGNKSTTRGGHFYMNELMGSNAGNVYSGTVTPTDAPSLILSTGGSHGQYPKTAMYGSESINILQLGYAADLAKTNPRYRTPTNYPFAFTQGQVFKSSFTHTNGQAAFGSVWANYAGENLASQQWGAYEDPLYWAIDGLTGTNNFYLTGDGNYLMNQIGHLPENSATNGESILFANSVMYVSQRKQCEICAANQNGQQTSHFVHRISAANANTVLTALQNGGNYWYPIDGCYQLTEDITLPEDWTSIKGFKGHWNSDVYEVTLNSKGTPLLANDSADGLSGWNLGTDPNKGTVNVFDGNVTRSTGVARVLGDLNDLFGTVDKNYAGYTVKILGSDNPRYMGSGEAYTCTVNTDSKYVISNLPCVFDSETRDGVLTARVYDASGKEVTQYGIVRTNVKQEFWDNDMTTPLYLGNFSVEPVTDEVTYESAQAFFSATTTSTEQPSLVRWEYRPNKSSAWQTVPTSWNITINNQEHQTADGDKVLTSKLTLNNTNPAWNGYEFRAVFSSAHYGTWSTYDYYLTGSIANLSSGTEQKQVAELGRSGKLTVKMWPAYAEQGANQTITAGENATFQSVGYALDNKTSIQGTWQYSTVEFDPFNGGYVLEWHDMSEDSGFEYSISNEPLVEEVRFDIASELSKVNPEANVEVLAQNAKFHTFSTSLTVKRVDLEKTGTRFRVHYTATSSYGTVRDWYSDIANEKTHSWTTDSGAFGDVAVKTLKNHSNILTVKPPELEVVTTPSANTEGAANIDTMTPDEYGQMLLIPNASSTIANGTAVYEAILYYKPGSLKSNQIVPQWQYMTYTNRTPKTWVDGNGNVCQEAKNLGLNVSVKNTSLGKVSSGKYAGYNAIKSVLYISNAPLRMYNPEDLTKYYFRCVGSLMYTTSKDTYNITRVDKWGGLSMDYTIALQHNGVLNYGQRNIINGVDVRSAEAIVSATKGKSSSTWKYPNLKIETPSARHINSAIVYFDSKIAHDSRDTIQINRTGIEALGITVSEYVPGEKLVLVSRTKNTVALSSWETALREYVSFVTYDKADFTANNVINDTTGGAKIHWVVDELRLAGVTVDPDTGHAYKVVNAGKVISWDEAFSLARNYDAEIGTNGYLAEVTSKEENNLLYNLKGGNNGVKMWLGAHKPSQWVWATSGTPLTYNPGISGDGAYLAMNSAGSWEALHPSSTSTKLVTMNSIGTGPSGLVLVGASHSGSVPLVNGHKYYVLAKFGDIGDSNCGGPISFPALGIYEKNNWDATEDNWLTGVDNIYTYGGATGDQVWTCTNDTFGTDITGKYAILHYLNIYDLTEAFGAGNEPSVEWCRDTFYGGGNPAVNASYVPSKTAYYTSQVITDVRYYAVEYDIPSLAFAVTDHSAKDSTYIGTDAAYTPPTGDKIVTVSIKGNTKVYDGQPIAPQDFVVAGNASANKGLFQISYTTESSTADYDDRVVSGNDWTQTGAVNAAIYKAVVTLTDAAKKAGWTIDSQNSQLECDLIVTQRPVHVYSNNNDKAYDGSSAGIIRNIQFADLDTNSGIIPGDNVQLTTTAVMGSYVDSDGQLATHNSQINNGGKEYTMIRNSAISPLDISHSNGSDPHYNYVLGTETYTGPINPRGLYVHSLYLEDEEYPRNVKSYDGNNTALVKDIVIDGIVEGDKISLAKTELKGTYATANAGEQLDANGQVLPDRLKKLTENVITLSEPAELSGNDYGDYFIQREAYSGAIARALLEVVVDNHSYIYGAEGPGYPSYDNEYLPNHPSDSWMNVDGLQGDDVLSLDENFTLAAKDSDGTQIEFTDRTPVGVYPVVPEGLTETNYPVLENYLVSITNGRVEVFAREIVITAADTDWYVKDEGIPQTYAIFEMANDDGETYKGIGNDAENDYTDMNLIGDDTIANTILVGGVAPTKESEAAMKEFGEEDSFRTVFNNGSNIPYATKWYVGAPALFLDIESDPTLYPCDWCEEYHGFEMGTDHWRIDGYNLTINQNPEMGDTLDVVEVENPLGEMVKNYTIRYVDGLLRVHPELRFQLEATVPLEVCMYGYAGDGEVVEPENYGITNYSNGAIQITDIEVKDDGWNIVDKAPTELLRGEMTMKMNDTQLVVGHNKPRNPDQWVIKADESEDSSGVQMLIPMTCYIAGGNVNERQESYITHVTYTIAEYGVTVPEVDGVELPDFIHGKPVTVDKNS